MLTAPYSMCTGIPGNYLRPAPGQASLNIMEMGRDGLQLGMSKAIHTAIKTKSHAIARAVRSGQTAGCIMSISRSGRSLTPERQKNS